MSEFAPEYTRKERIILLAKLFAWAIPLFAITKYLFFPWFQTYAEKAPCLNYGSFTGTEVILYSCFVGLPLLMALALFALEGTKCVKVIRLGQSPLPGEKVFKPTKYKYGLRAKLRPILTLISIGLIVGYSVYSFFTVQELSRVLSVEKAEFCKGVYE